MRGGVHDTFREITIHTAKCDICNKHNTSKMYRCEKCGRQCCSPCWDKKGGDGRHQLHNKDKISYKGPRAPDLPPKEEPSRVKIEAQSPPQMSGRKRNRGAQTSDLPATSAGAYAPTAISPKSVEQPEESERKRRRQADVEDAAKQEEAESTREPDPIRVSDKPDKSIKQQGPLQKTTRTSGLDHDYDLDSAVNNLIGAAGSDTESETTETPENCKDQKGLNSIVEAIDIIERSSSPHRTSLTATPASNAPSTMMATHDVRTPHHTQPWTPVNAGYTWPSHEVKTPKHSGLPTPFAGVSASPQPASRYLFANQDSLAPRRLLDDGEEGENERLSYVDRNFSQGQISNGLPEASLVARGQNRLARGSTYTKFDA